MRDNFRDDGRSAGDETFEAYAYAFILAVLALGFLFGLGVARVADWGHAP